MVLHGEVLLERLGSEFADHYAIGMSRGSPRFHKKTLWFHSYFLVEHLAFTENVKYEMFEDHAC